MQAVYENTSFDLEDVVAEELPFMSAFYRSGSELNTDVKDLLAFPVQHEDHMPFYTIRHSTTFKVAEAFDLFYGMMLAALRVAFEDEQLLRKYFDCNFIRKHGNRFIPYAKHTFRQRHPALYGRFDACFDPDKERINGVYEFNGDTPVMLFESVNLQARFSGQLETEQFNSWWVDATQYFWQKYHNVVVACDASYVEDMATCETIAQMFDAADTPCVSFVDLKELDFDHLHSSKPFITADGVVPDALYILSPWEEMIENFPAMLSNWERWADSVHIFEPAWRWFLSHKGMMALCTHLMETDRQFATLYSRAPLIDTYLEKERFVSQGVPFVSKPVIGRLSNNITIYNGNGVEQVGTGGFYLDENVVYQAYCKPEQVVGRNNFIIGIWMAPTGGIGSCASTMCIREFDSEVLSISNERFIPHIVVED